MTENDPKIHDSAEAARKVVDAHLAQADGHLEPVDRGAILDAAPELGAELEIEIEKLRQIRRARRTVSSLGGSLGMSPPLPEELPPPEIPGYLVAHEIHRGGQGVVYKATAIGSDQPVAIKVMRGGPFAGPHDRARFEREARILSRIEHPNIVAARDVGSTAGCTFFVMDYVPGATLDEFVEQSDLEPREIAALIADIAEAVHAAHQRGIIHRDLKPGNIRVDPTGTPYVLDFGLAKLDASFDGGSLQVLHTTTGAFVGSMPWSSPEQAAGRSDEIDVRTDVHALGVILYHLVTGRFPFDIEGTARDILQRIEHDEPTPPSVHTDDFDDELETIVLKCLAKVPDRRYDGAGALARDLRRWLAGHPIDARRDSRWYVLRKTVQRHRLPIALGATAFIVLVTFVIVLAILLVQNERARVTAQREAETSRQVVESLRGVFQTLNPTHAGRSDVTVRELLDASVESVIGRLDEQSDVRVQAMSFIAETYESHGYYDEALLWRKRVLDQRIDLERPGSEITVARWKLACALYHAARFEESEVAFRAVLVECSPEEEEWPTYQAGLAAVMHARGDLDVASRLYREILDVYRRRFGDQDARVAATWHALALVEQDLGDSGAAEEHLRAALRARELRSPDSLPVADTLMHLASLMREASRYEEARPMYVRALKLRRDHLGDAHPATAESLHGLGALEKDESNYAEAERLYLQALAVREEVYGADHPEVGVSLNNLGTLAEAQSDFTQAESHHRRALKIFRSIHDGDHVDVARSHQNLGRVLVDLDRTEEAEPLLRAAVSELRSVGNDREVAAALRDLARLLRRQRRFDEVEGILREAIDRQEALLGKVHHDVAGSYVELGSLQGYLQQFEAAEESLQGAIEIYRQVHGNDHSYVGVALGNLAPIVAQQGRVAASIPIFREALEIHRLRFDADHERTARLESVFGKYLTVLGEYDEAADVLDHSVRVLIERRGVDHGLTELARRRRAAVETERVLKTSGDVER